MIPPPAPYTLPLWKPCVLPTIAILFPSPLFVVTVGAIPSELNTFPFIPCPEGCVFPMHITPPFPSVCGSLSHSPLSEGRSLSPFPVRSCCSLFHRPHSVLSLSLSRCYDVRFSATAIHFAKSGSNPNSYRVYEVGGIAPIRFSHPNLLYSWNTIFSICSLERKYFFGTSGSKMSNSIDPFPVLWNVPF